MGTLHEHEPGDAPLRRSQHNTCLKEHLCNPLGAKNMASFPLKTQEWWENRHCLQQSSLLDIHCPGLWRNAVRLIPLALKLQLLCTLSGIVQMRSCRRVPPLRCVEYRYDADAPQDSPPSIPSIFIQALSHVDYMACAAYRCF